jgi:predicted GNAT family N-acyltransferase
MTNARIQTGTWSELERDAAPIRAQVFIEEQQVPAELEYDEFDAVSLHAVAYGADGSPLGTGRLLPDGHVGRMAVHRHARGLGVGGAILDALVAQGLAQGHRVLLLHAQLQARKFYETRGFAAEGETFMEAGIPHVLMALRVKLN